jgi:FlaG/FlaF family flagellin (archaellin)
MSAKNKCFHSFFSRAKTRVSSMNDNGVSDVVGSMMMLTITIIMAAIVASAIFGMKPPADVPQVSIKIQENASSISNIDLIHMGGEPVRVSDLKFLSESVEINVNASSQINDTGVWTIGKTITLDTSDTSLNIVHIPSKELLQ